MSKIDFHIFKSNTDAIATNRGFYYQYLSTVKIWLENFINNVDNEIFCEREEDIFELNSKEEIYKFSQIKCYSDGFSLKSPEIASSLLNFYKLYQKYKSQYKGTFCFHTNSTIKVRAGKSLSNWYNKQMQGDFSPTEFIEETRNIFLDLLKEKLNKYLEKAFENKDIIDANKKYNNYVELVKSDDFIQFLGLIRWEFSSIAKTEEAISDLVKEIKGIILSGKLDYDSGINENFILGYLLNTVIEKSTETIEDNRLLNNNLLKIILNSTDLKQHLKEKLKKEIVLLMTNDFQIMENLEDINKTTLATHKMVAELHKAVLKENEKSSLISNLTVQVKNWFNAIGYKFENQEIINNDEIFGFIINIRNRRGYDRVLILCISEPVEINHLYKLHELTKDFKCSEGWVITYKRISKSVRNKIGKEEYNNLFCYTIDELIDNDIDFSGYFDWLDSEVISRDISSKFIPLYCKRDIFEKETNIKLDTSKYLIDEYIDQWLDDPSKKHISILGEFGTGKTWFALHYAWVKLQDYKSAMQRGVNRPRIPIFIALRDFAKSVNIEGVFSEFFFKKHNSPIPTYEAFLELNKMGKLLLIFDGFDEMADRIDNQKMINNFWELARTIDDNSKVILTCRNEHFPEARQGRELLNAKLKASTQHLVIKNPEFEVLDLLKLNKKQIKELLQLHTTEKVVKKIMKNSILLDLAARPIMTELIIESLKDIEEGKPIDISRVYLYAIREKFKKDITEERTFTSVSDKLYFMCELSWEMISTDRMSIHYRLFPERIRSLFNDVVKEQKDIDHWQYDMMGQSMLIRNDDGEYKPSHRSLLEFFTAYKFAAELGVMDNDFKDFAIGKENISDLIPQNYEWNEFFKKSSSLNLGDFKRITISQLKNTFGHQVLSRAILDLITNMISIRSRKTLDTFNEIINDCRSKKFEDVKYIVTNLIIIITNDQPDYFKEKDLSNLVIKNFEVPQKLKDAQWLYHGSMKAVDFSGTNFTNSDLTNANFGFPLYREFVSGNIVKTIFTNANLKGFQFHFNQIDSVAFLKDRNIIAIGSPDEIRLLNADLTVIKYINATGWDIEFSPNGKFMAHSGYGILYIRNTTDFEIEWEHEFSVQFNPNAQEKGKNLWTGGFVFSNDNKKIFTACNNSFVYECDIVAKKEVGTFQCFEGAETISISFDQKYIVCSEFNAFSLWETKSRKKIKFEKTKKDKLNKFRARFHPQKNLLFIAEGNRIRCYDILNDIFLFEIEIENIGDFCFSLDGNTIYIHNNYNIYIIDLKEKAIINNYRIEVLNSTEKKSHENIEKIVYDSNGDNLVLMTRKQIVIFNIHVEDVIDIYQNLITVEGSDFKQVIGLDEDILEQLKKNGAAL
ncbi:pentapeptide repeat protein [Flavobacterium araucananum]|uniref:NACHT-associated inactive Restriction Endonuclease 1 sensor domain-containing protein n=1 Tax=Flavobacterium araucananum TaxID=946678 RepID=A0A227NRV9_9FLAO|nr:NACHT domain-containing protein [Flavobacterium araucananum]OXE99719.1 hypothetical protein B0A64_21040 [Flavobacterium araucananum]PWJ95576.1 pentapeptide repeat protein [Flavobacterium araucananum]